MKSLEDMDIHELRTRKDELMAEMEAVVSRIQEVHRMGARLPPQLEPETERAPGPNAHPEGEDEEDGA